MFEALLTVARNLELSPMMGLVSSLKVLILFWIVSSVSLKFSPSFNLQNVTLRSSEAREELLMQGEIDGVDQMKTFDAST